MSMPSLFFIANAMNAKIMITDFNLAQMAEFHAVDWLNINSLAKALNPDFSIGEICNVGLGKKGTEPGQAVGFLSDGSMVVVNDGNDLIGHAVRIEVQSILPSAGGKIVLRGLWAQVKRHNHPLLLNLKVFIMWM